MSGRFACYLTLVMMYFQLTKTIFGIFEYLKNIIFCHISNQLLVDSLSFKILESNHCYDDSQRVGDDAYTHQCRNQGKPFVFINKKKVTVQFLLR